MKKRELLAAAIVRDYRFKDKRTYALHLIYLSNIKRQFKVLEEVACKDGTVLARIVTQYNNADLIDLEA